MEPTSSISEKSSNSRCKLRRSKSDNRMKERNEYLPEDRKRSDSSSRHGSTNSVSSCSDVVSSRRRVGSTASAAMDALRGSEGGAQESSTARSMYSPSGSKRELDTVLVRADSLNSIGSDNSDSGFRLETRTHDANKSLRGDNAAKLLSTIAGLKVQSMPFSALLSSLLLNSTLLCIGLPIPVPINSIPYSLSSIIFISTTHVCGSDAQQIARQKLYSRSILNTFLLYSPFSVLCSLCLPNSISRLE